MQGSCKAFYIVQQKYTMHSLCSMTHEADIPNVRRRRKRTVEKTMISRRDSTKMKQRTKTIKMTLPQRESANQMILIVPQKNLTSIYLEASQVVYEPLLAIFCVLRLYCYCTNFMASTILYIWSIYLGLQF